MKCHCPELQLDLTLDPAWKIGIGGEGTVYAPTERPSSVAKVYHHPGRDHQRKLEAMLTRSCVPAQGQRPFVAWPEGLLWAGTKRAQFLGYVMPRVTDTCAAIDLYIPRARRSRCPAFDYRYLLRTALNLARCVGEVHSRGYVIGDLNEGSFLVGRDASVTLVDADSWQVPALNGLAVHPCLVGKPEFTPPERQRVDPRRVARREREDDFALAVLIFKLLMEGTHPYDGVFRGSGEVPSIPERIAQGWFPYRRGTIPFKPKPGAPPFRMLHPNIRSLFRQAFDRSLNGSPARPSAREWARTLVTAEQALAQCASNPRHWFGRHLAKCPWCIRAMQLGLEAFPAGPAALTRSPKRSACPKRKTVRRRKTQPRIPKPPPRPNPRQRPSLPRTTPAPAAPVIHAVSNPWLRRVAIALGSVGCGFLRMVLRFLVDRLQ